LVLLIASFQSTPLVSAVHVGEESDGHDRHRQPLESTAASPAGAVLVESPPAQSPVAAGSGESAAASGTAAPPSLPLVPAVPAAASPVAQAAADDPIAAAAAVGPMPTEQSVVAPGMEPAAGAMQGAPLAVPPLPAGPPQPQAGDDGIADLQAKLLKVEAEAAEEFKKTDDKALNATSATDALNATSATLPHDETAAAGAMAAAGEAQKKVHSADPAAAAAAAAVAQQEQQQQQAAAEAAAAAQADAAAATAAAAATQQEQQQHQAAAAAAAAAVADAEAATAAANCGQAPAEPPPLPAVATTAAPRAKILSQRENETSSVASNRQEEEVFWLTQKLIDVHWGLHQWPWGVLIWLIISPAFFWFVYYLIFARDDMWAEMEKSAATMSAAGIACDEINEKLRLQLMVDHAQHDFNLKKNEFVSFMRFCHDDPVRLGGSKADSELGAHIKAFTSMWLRIFRECSRCPATKPFEVISREEFHKCPKNVSGIGGYISKKLADVEVGFVDLAPHKDNRGRKVSGWLAFGEGREAWPTPWREELLRKANRIPKDTSWGIVPSWLSFCHSNSNYLFLPREERLSSTRDEFYPLELNCFCGCLRINLVSCQHVWIILYWFFLIAMAKWYHHHGTLGYASGVLGFYLVLVAFLITSFVLWRFENIEHLAQLQRVRNVYVKEEEDLLRMQQEVEEFNANRSSIMMLWTNRTRPRLNIMNEILKKLKHTRWSSLFACAEFLAAVNDGLNHMENTLGPTECYLSHSPGKLLSREAQAIIRKQLDKVAETIQISDAREVSQMAKDIMVVPNLLAVRVLGCRGLPNGCAGFCSLNSYVKMRTKQGSNNWIRTKSIENETSPRWHAKDAAADPCTGDCDGEKYPPPDHRQAEFRFLVEGRGKELECHVMDGPDEQRSVTDSPHDREETFVGRANFTIDNLRPGEWIRISRTLEECAGQSGSSLELEVFLAREATDLLAIMADTNLVDTGCEACVLEEHHTHADQFARSHGAELYDYMKFNPRPAVDGAKKVDGSKK
jgi:hypothetical protein